MAVRGRNLSPAAGANYRAHLIKGDETAGSNGTTAGHNNLALAARTSIVVKELGLTVMTGSAGATTTAPAGGNATVKFYYKLPAAMPAALATVSIPGSTATGTEYTSRDGTLVFADGLKNESDRVFQKGTVVAFEFDSGADGNTGNEFDNFVGFCFAPEYGAPPA